MGFRVWQRALNVESPKMGFLCCEPGSADAGFVWNFATGDFVAPSTNPLIADCSTALTLLDDWTPLASSLYYLDVTTLGGSPGRIIPLVFANDVLIAQGEELYVRGNERVDSFLNSQLFTGVTVGTWLKALGAVFAACDPSVSGDVVTLPFKYPNQSGTLLATVLLDKTENGNRTSVSLPS